MISWVGQFWRRGTPKHCSFVAPPPPLHIYCWYFNKSLISTLKSYACIQIKRHREYFITMILLEKIASSQISPTPQLSCWVMGFCICVWICINICICIWICICICICISICKCISVWFLYMCLHMYWSCICDCIFCLNFYLYFYLYLYLCLYSFFCICFRKDLFFSAPPPRRSLAE